MYLKRSTHNHIKNFEKSVAAVIENKKGIGSAAQKFNVFFKTLSDRINRRHLKNVGKPTYITEAKELLIGYIKYMTSGSFLLNIKRICVWVILLRSEQPEQFCRTA